MNIPYKKENVINFNALSKKSSDSSKTPYQLKKEILGEREKIDRSDTVDDIYNKFKDININMPYFYNRLKELLSKIEYAKYHYNIKKRPEKIAYIKEIESFLYNEYKDKAIQAKEAIIRENKKLYPAKKGGRKTKRSKHSKKAKRTRKH